MVLANCHIWRKSFMYHKRVNDSRDSRKICHMWSLVNETTSPLLKNKQTNNFFFTLFRPKVFKQLHKFLNQSVWLRECSTAAENYRELIAHSSASMEGSSQLGKHSSYSSVHRITELCAGDSLPFCSKVHCPCQDTFNFICIAFNINDS